MEIVLGMQNKQSIALQVVVASRSLSGSENLPAGRRSFPPACGLGTAKLETCEGNLITRDFNLRITIQICFYNNFINHLNTDNTTLVFILLTNIS